MKLSPIVGVLVAFYIIHLTFFVYCSTIQRSLSDDIRNGISVAGKILGVDSPSNIALVSNIAELVARSFMKNANKPSDSDRRQFMSRPSQNLENFGEIPQQIASQQQFDSNEEQLNIDDNVIIGNNGNGGSTTTTTEVDHGFLGSVLRVLGMDTGKIGALAINGIIFIAQMIGRSFISAVSSMVGAKPNENIKVSAERPRSLTENDENSKEPTQIWENTIHWLLNQSKTNAYLSQQIETMLDRNLPDRIVQLVDVGNGGGAAAPAMSRQSTDCIKQLLCKTAPFIWSMQRAVSAEINDSHTEANETDGDDDIDVDAPSSDARQKATADDDYRLKTFSKYLPSDKEFMKHGVICENQYYACKLF